MKLWFVGACLVLSCALPALGEEGTASQKLPLMTPEAPQSSVSSGTGFFVSSEGHMVTAHHVVREREHVFIRHGVPVKLLPAQVIKRDVKLDLALIKVDVSSKPLQLAKWDEVPMGLEGYVVGFPMPNLQGRSLKITQGLINGEAAMSRGRRLFTITADVQTGNSGGPVLTPDGLVVGVVHSKLDAMKIFEKTKDLPQNVNFAVGADVLANFLETAGVQPRVLAPDLTNVLRPFQLLKMSQDSVAMVIASDKAPAGSTASKP